MTKRAVLVAASIFWIGSTHLIAQSTTNLSFLPNAAYGSGEWLGGSADNAGRLGAQIEVSRAPYWSGVVDVDAWDTNGSCSITVACDGGGWSLGGGLNVRLPWTTSSTYWPFISLGAGRFWGNNGTSDQTILRAGAGVDLSLSSKVGLRSELRYTQFSSDERFLMVQAGLRLTFAELFTAQGSN